MQGELRSRTVFIDHWDDGLSVARARQGAGGIDFLRIGGDGEPGILNLWSYEGTSRPVLQQDITVNSLSNYLTNYFEPGKVPANTGEGMWYQGLHMIVQIVKETMADGGYLEFANCRAAGVADGGANHSMLPLIMEAFLKATTGKSINVLMYRKWVRIDSRGDLRELDHVSENALP